MKRTDQISSSIERQMRTVRLAFGVLGSVALLSVGCTESKAPQASHKSPKPVAVGLDVGPDHKVMLPATPDKLVDSGVDVIGTANVSFHDASGDSGSTYVFVEERKVPTAPGETSTSIAKRLLATSVFAPKDGGLSEGLTEFRHVTLDQATIDATAPQLTGIIDTERGHQMLVAGVDHPEPSMILLEQPWAAAVDK